MVEQHGVEEGQLPDDDVPVKGLRQPERQAIAGDTHVQISEGMNGSQAMQKPVDGNAILLGECHTHAQANGHGCVGTDADVRETKCQRTAQIEERNGNLPAPMKETQANRSVGRHEGEARHPPKDGRRSSEAGKEGARDRAQDGGEDRWSRSRALGRERQEEKDKDARQETTRDKEHDREYHRERPRDRDRSRDRPRDRDWDKDDRRRHDDHRRRVDQDRHRQMDRDRDRAHCARGQDPPGRRVDDRKDRAAYAREPAVRSESRAVGEHPGTDPDTGSKYVRELRSTRDEPADQNASMTARSVSPDVADSHAGAAAARNGEIMASAAHNGPVSLEEMLRRKREAEVEAARPKFMSRAERQALALERRKQQAEAMRAQTDAVRAEARAMHRGQPLAASLRPQAAAHGRPLAAGSGQRDKEGREAERERERELELIRQQYLGTQKRKRRIAKASDKFRFNFEWDAKEDTYEPALHQGALLFGRGVVAGVDRRAQREDAAHAEQMLLSRMRQARGELTTEDDVRRDVARAVRASHIDDDPVMKQKHWTEKSLDEMTSRDWRIFREDHRVSYRNAGQNAPMPFRSWDEMPLPKQLRSAIDDLGYALPTPIQMASIPFGLRQRDVIGLAETGSGKTAAFVLPMLKYIMSQPPMTEAVAAEGPYALILAPTRELAQQIEEEAKGLAKYTGFRTACIVGGASYEDQIGKLRRGAEIVVATPGRLLDCLRRSFAVLNQCNYIVLDEADRMIDLGFEPQVMDVLAAMPSSTLKPDTDPDVLDSTRVYRTTYMFSATMPPPVERIAKRYLRRPVVVTIGSVGRATENVTQRVEWMDRKSKPAALTRALDTFQHSVAHLSGEDDGFKIIIFVNNRENSEDVYNQLLRMDRYHVALLHGGKSQEQREESIKAFRDGDVDVMIATDVAGRGIDVKDIGLVINYDMPHTIENYTHRIGRTGRAGRKGTAVTFLGSSDEKTFYDLKSLLEDAKVHVPPQLANHEAAKNKPGAFESKKDTTLYAA